MIHSINKNPAPPLQMVLHYHVLKWSLRIAWFITFLVALFIFVAYSPERRIVGCIQSVCLGCYFVFLYAVALRRIKTIRQLDIVAALFLIVPMALHAWGIYQYPQGDLTGIVVGLLILASMAFASHLFFFVFALVGVAMVVIATLASGVEILGSFWLNILFVAPGVSFTTRVVVQENYNLLLERLKSEQQLSAELAATGDALKLSKQEQEQSQFDLALSDLQLSSVLSKAPIILCVMDQDGIYTQSRGHGLQKLGLKENEIEGEQFVSLYKEHPEVLKAFEEARQGNSSQVRVSFAPGLTHEIQYSPVYSDDKKLAGVVGVGLDVSQSALAERQKMELESQLLQAQKMESLGLLASGVAHDFNNFLGAIVAFCELLDSKTNLNQVQSINRDDIAGEIKKIAMNASGVCEQMLVFAGKSTHEKSDVDLNSLVNELRQFFRAIVSSEIELNIELTPTPIPVVVNRLLIQQAIVNLLKNACEAIKDQAKVGQILISTKVVDGLPSECLQGIRIGKNDSVRSEDSFAVLTVQDNGGGIEASELQRVFEPYYSSKSSGHGFGLPMTAGVIKNHNGFIWCDSGASGTRIKLVFPISKSTAAPDSSGIRPPPFSTKAGERVLLIDDEAMITRSIGLMLERVGYNTTTAGSGLKALDLIDAGGEFDCFIVDFSMPEMNGLEFLAELRKRGIKTPVILCSGYFELPENEEVLPEATLHKPYSIAELKETIGKVCTAQKRETIS